MVNHISNFDPFKKEKQPKAEVIREVIVVKEYIKVRDKDSTKRTARHLSHTEFCQIANDSKVIIRFEDNLIIEEETGCLLWLPSIEKQVGYGTFSVGDYTWAAHRFSWLYYKGEIPEGMLVCHKCDVPACVNVKHLFLGSHADNTRDMIEKGRHGGANKRNRKLTGEQVAIVRTDRTKDYRGWAKAFDVTPSAIHAAMYGRTWIDLKDPPPLPLPERKYPTDWEATSAECLKNVQEYDAMVAALLSRKSMFPDKK